VVEGALDEQKIEGSYFPPAKTVHLETCWGENCSCVLLSGPGKALRELGKHYTSRGIVEKD
jgi:hypothetical protein